MFSAYLRYHFGLRRMIAAMRKISAVAIVYLVF